MRIGHYILCDNRLHTVLHMLELHKKSISIIGKILYKMDYNNDKFIHAPKYSYNEVMQLLEFVGVIECE